eukprot:12736001-Ditylum_brightwellii.AAC.1
MPACVIQSISKGAAHAKKDIEKMHRHYCLHIGVECADTAWCALQQQQAEDNISPHLKSHEIQTVEM